MTKKDKILKILNQMSNELCEEDLVNTVDMYQDILDKLHGQIRDAVIAIKALPEEDV